MKLRGAPAKTSRSVGGESSEMKQRGKGKPRGKAETNTDQFKEETSVAEEVTDESSTAEFAENGEQGKKQPSGRYIIFMGGLPYHSTEYDVRQFFGRSVGLKITSIRLLTEKGSNKPRGCAFVELVNKEAFSKALDFNGHELDGRKIRIEMTVGGGGKAALRLAKLTKKRRMLQRLRRKKIRKFKEGRGVRKEGEIARPLDETATAAMH